MPSSNSTHYHHQHHHSSFSMPSANVLICEFCEKEGPKPVIWPESTTLKNADAWALRLISVQLEPDDIFLLVDRETDERIVCLYSVLLDGQYRGFLRTYCIATRISSPPSRGPLGHARYRAATGMLKMIDRNLKSRNIIVFRRQASTILKQMSSEDNCSTLETLKNLRLVDPALCPQFDGLSWDDSAVFLKANIIAQKRTRSLPNLNLTGTYEKLNPISFNDLAQLGKEEAEHLSISRSIMIDNDVNNPFENRKFYSVLKDSLFAYMRGMSIAYIGHESHWLIRLICSVLEQPLIKCSETDTIDSIVKSNPPQIFKMNDIISFRGQGFCLLSASRIEETLDTDICFLNLAENGGKARLPRYSDRFLQSIVQKPPRNTKILEFKELLMFLCTLFRGHLCTINEWASLVATISSNEINVDNRLVLPKEFGECDKEMIYYLAWMLSSKNRHEFHRPRFSNRMRENKMFCANNTHWYFG